MTSNSPQSLQDWNGGEVPIRFSRGADHVPYVVDWTHNVLGLQAGQQPPDFLMKQVRGYAARPAWFTEPDAETLSAKLGRISKFQSLRSEDALTWSWFGTLTAADASTRREVIHWLFERLGFECEACDPTITQWSRVKHPSTGGSNGPEIDAIVDDTSRAKIYVEAKWRAKLGTGKGATEGTQDDQIVLRRNALRLDPETIWNNRDYAVLGISNTKAPDLGVYAEQPESPLLRPIHIRWLTWHDLAECEHHPFAAEFRRYLDWKALHGT